MVFGISWQRLLSNLIGAVGVCMAGHQALQSTGHTIDWHAWLTGVGLCVVSNLVGLVQKPAA